MEPDDREFLLPEVDKTTESMYQDEIESAIARVKSGSYVAQCADISSTITNDIDKKFEIGASIATGGMGEILKVVEQNSRRTVAMKVIKSKMAPSSRLLRRFLREARVTAQLEHPNIVPVYEISVDSSGNPFYTMKKVKGVTLSSILSGLADGNEKIACEYPLAKLLNIFQGVCDGVAFAHANNII